MMKCVVAAILIGLVAGAAAHDDYFDDHDSFHHNHPVNHSDGGWVVFWIIILIGGCLFIGFLFVGVNDWGGYHNITEGYFEQPGGKRVYYREDRHTDGPSPYNRYANPGHHHGSNGGKNQYDSFGGAMNRAKIGSADLDSVVLNFDV